MNIYSKLFLPDRSEKGADWHIRMKSFYMTNKPRSVLRLKTLLFTLIELLVVIGIIAILLTILLPALNTAKKKVYGTKCKNKLKQFSVAMYNYANDNEGWLLSCYDANTPPYVFHRRLWDLNYLPAPRSNIPWEDWSTVCPLADKSYSYYNNVTKALCYSIHAYYCDDITAAGNIGRLCKISRVPKQSRTVWMTDGGGEGAGQYIVSNWSLQNIKYRHFKKANALFFDGHVEGKSITELSNTDVW